MRGWQNALVMYIFSIQKVFPLSVLHVIIIGTTFNYVVRASEGNISLFKRSSSSASSGSQLDNPILVQINKRRGLQVKFYGIHISQKNMSKGDV